MVMISAMQAKRVNRPNIRRMEQKNSAKMASAIEAGPPIPKKS
jgi:hypothetical protein